MSAQNFVPKIAALLFLVLLGACGSVPSFSQLAADAAAVPVPTGVTFVNQTSITNDGPGLTSTKSEEVNRVFQTSIPRQKLLSARPTLTTRRALAAATITASSRLCHGPGRGDRMVFDLG